MKDLVIIEILLEAGADKKHKDSRGRTASDLFKKNRNIQLIYKKLEIN